MLKPRRELQLIVGSIIVFVLCAIGVSIDATSSIDRELSLLTYNFLDNDLVNTVLLVITDYTISLVAGACVIVGILFYRKLFLRIVMFGLATGLVWLVIEVAKNSFFRLRPFIRESNIAYLAQYSPDGFGFPSHHAGIAFFIAFFTIHALRLKGWVKIAVYLLAALVVFSRVYLGAHYWLDVIGGVAVGVYFGAIEIVVYYRLFKR